VTQFLKIIFIFLKQLNLKLAFCCRKNNSFSTEMDVSSLKNGQYFLQIEMVNRKIKPQRFEIAR
jgi:hypothetical protein